MVTNMSKPITLTFTWNKETYMKASELAYRYELQKSNRRFLGWFFVALTQFGVVAAMKKGSIGLLLVSTLLVVYWYGLRWPLRRVLLEKSYNTIQAANHVFHIVASEHAIAIDKKSILWKDFTHIASLSDGFILYTTSEFFFFPVSSFEDIESKNTFAALAKEKVNSYERL